MTRMQLASTLSVVFAVVVALAGRADADEQDCSDAKAAYKTVIERFVSVRATRVALNPSNSALACVDTQLQQLMLLADQAARASRRACEAVDEEELGTALASLEQGVQASALASEAADLCVESRNVDVVAGIARAFASNAAIAAHKTRVLALIQQARNENEQITINCVMAQYYDASYYASASAQLLGFALWSVDSNDADSVLWYAQYLESLESSGAATVASAERCWPQ